MQYDGIIPMEFYESSILEKVDIQREWLWGAFHFGFNSSPPWKARLECKCLANFVDCKSKIIYIYKYFFSCSTQTCTNFTSKYVQSAVERYCFISMYKYV
jgi:hypothetical protein